MRGARGGGVHAHAAPRVDMFERCRLLEEINRIVAIECDVGREEQRAQATPEVGDRHALRLPILPGELEHSPGAERVGDADGFRKARADHLLVTIARGILINVASWERIKRAWAFLLPCSISRVQHAVLRCILHSPCRRRSCQARSAAIVLGRWGRQTTETSLHGQCNWLGPSGIRLGCRFRCTAGCRCRG